MTKRFIKQWFLKNEMLLNGTKMPEGYSIYSHQVAGHRFETGKQGKNEVKCLGLSHKTNIYIHTIYIYMQISEYLKYNIRYFVVGFAYV